MTDQRKKSADGGHEAREVAPELRVGMQDGQALCAKCWRRRHCAKRLSAVHLPITAAGRISQPRPADRANGRLEAGGPSSAGWRAVPRHDRVSARVARSSSWRSFALQFGRIRGITRAQVACPIKLAADGSCQGARDAALLAVMSNAMLTASDAARLLVGDVSIYADGTARVFLRATQATEEPVPVGLWQGSTRRLRQWLAWYNPHPDERLFQRLDHRQKPVGPISRQAIVAIIRKRARAAGIEGNFGSESLRIGAAESMAEAGRTVKQIQKAGRWKTRRTALGHAWRAWARKSAEERERRYRRQ